MRLKDIVLQHATWAAVACK